MPSSFSGAGSSASLDRAKALEELAEVLPEHRLEHLVLGGEVVVEEAVRDPRLARDVPDPRAVVAAACEHAHGRVENAAAAILLDD